MVYWKCMVFSSRALNLNLINQSTAQPVHSLQLKLVLTGTEETNTETKQ